MACPEALGTIITSALARANTPGISAEALLFVKRLFAHWYISKDLLFNLTSASINTSNTHELSLSSLTTFRAPYQLLLNGIRAPLIERPFKDLNPAIVNDVANAAVGTPYAFCVQPDRTKILLYSRPAQSYTATLYYYQAPSTAAWTTATFTEYEDALVIESVIADWALNYDKEPLQVLITRLTEKLQAEYENRYEPIGRANQQTLRWGINYNKVRGD